MTIEERETRADIGDAYLFTAQDQDTRLIAAHTLGKRSADNARRFMVQLRNRLAEIQPVHQLRRLQTQQIQINKYERINKFSKIWHRR